MPYKTEQAATFYFEFYSYLKTHGRPLSPHQWLKCESMIGIEADLIDVGRQTKEQANDSIHHYLTVIGI